MRKGLVVLFVFAAACNPKDPVPVPSVVDYMPLRKGAFQIYHVDSVVVSQNSESTYTYDLKTEVIDSFPSAEGGYTYLIQRSKRIASSSPWTSLETWSARVSAFIAVINEGNISYVKIAGPPGNEKEWNGNALNFLSGSEKCLGGDAYTCDNYIIGSFEKPYETAGGIHFDNTLTVIQNENNDFIVFQDKRTEVYAKHAGLIDREIIQLNYCTTPSCLGTQFVDHGLKYKQTIVEYGSH